jgi:glycosyltransferase involved in cell wall biosynthesis
VTRTIWAPAASAQIACDVGHTFNEKRIPKGPQLSDNVQGHFSVDPPWKMPEQKPTGVVCVDVEDYFLAESSSDHGTASRPDQVLVSVVIPAYNAADYIAHTIDSVLAQTFSQYEITVVNDGSPDTPRLEKALAPYLHLIRYIKQENQGPSGARNKGILESRGKYVAFLDSDDYWLPFHLQAQLQLLEKDPTLSLVYANGILTLDGAAVRTCFQASPQTYPVTFEALVAEDCTVATSATVASRQALLQAGLFDQRFKHCEDFDLWARVLFRGFRIDYSRQIQIVRRLSNGLSSDTDSMKRSRLAVLQKLSSQLPLSEAQKRVVLQRQAYVASLLQLELCKKALLAGELGEALKAAQSAKTAFDTWKMRIVVLTLRVAPRFLAVMYRAYTGILAWRNRLRLILRRMKMRSRARNIRGHSAISRPGIPGTDPAEQQTRVAM